MCASGVKPANRWMVYLQQLDEQSEQQADRRNLAFRERLRRLARYETYDTLDGFAAKLTAHLSSLVAESAAAERDAVDSDQLGAAPEQPRRHLPATNETFAESRAALEQVAVGLGADEGAVDKVALLRAHVAVLAELSTRHTSSLMHVHDLMRLYGHRDEVTLPANERYFVGRSMAGLGNAGAGWALLHQTDVDGFGALLLDSSEGVRQGAIEQLGTAGLDVFVQLIAKRMGKTESTVLARIWQAQGNDPGALRALIAVLADSNIDDVDVLLACHVAEEGAQDVQAFETLVGRLLTSDPTAALGLMSDKPSWVPAFAQARLASQLEAVGKRRLMELRDGPLGLSRLVMRLLVEAGWLEEDEIRTALADSDDQVRRLAPDFRS